MKKILDRQIEKHLGYLSSKEKEKMKGFFEEILSMYQAFEDDRKMMDRSLEISSQEMMENNQMLINQSEELKKVFEDILTSIKELDTTKNSRFSEMKIGNLSGYLRELIRESKRNRIEVVKQKNYLFTIVDNIGEGLMVLNSEGKIVMFNKIAEKLTGMKHESLINKNYSDNIFFYSEKAGQGLPDIIEKTIQTHTIEFLFDGVVLKNKKDQQIPVSLIVSPIGQRSEEGMGTVVVFRDITQERELDRLKDEFVSIASHELRTPMTVINGYATLILEEQLGKLNDNQRSYLLRIKNNVKQLIALVNDMLNVSRLESQKVQIEKGSLAIQDFCKSLTDEYQDMFSGKGIQLQTDIVSGTLFTDGDKLRQILVNLLGNAFKFTPKGGKVTLKVQKNPNNMEFSIIDTGEGIAQKDIELLFHKFSQVNSYLHNKSEGTGLGLAICKMLVELLGGEIGVESKEGEGSRFFFTIPL